MIVKVLGIEQGCPGLSLHKSDFLVNILRDPRIDRMTVAYGSAIRDAICSSVSS